MPVPPCNTSGFNGAPDRVQMVEVESRPAGERDMNVADADREQVYSGRADEGSRAVGIRLLALTVREGWDARRKLAEFGLDRHVARPRVVDEISHPPHIVVVGSGWVRRHDEIEAGGDCGPGPVVLRAFVEDEAAGNFRVGRGGPAERSIP